ncbi:MFS transporter [Sporosarcina sp. P3]|uniref:CynX/NimT family MFS transporter n=1 Tax=Sporosarcina sp. P3 TaxID=2048245 RepID=UPI000C171D52|nr:MFS transporter [Sporosarcina sp. P3]PID21130.1 MFS transporter [Sporosarcina sp. P3]
MKNNQINQNYGKFILLVLGILLIAANLRFSITPVGPLITVIRHDFDLSSSTAGLLTTIPILAFSIFSIFAPKLAIRFKDENILMASLVILFTGILIRSLPNVFFLLVGTFVLGSAIAVGNVLLPSFIMNKLPNQAGIMTGLYTTFMNLFGAIASTLSFPVSQTMGFGWRNTLALPSILVLITILIWLPQLFNNTHLFKRNYKSRRKIGLWKSTTAWYVTLFMGVQSLVYFVMLSWLPEIYISKGMDPSKAGFMLGTMLLCSIPSNFIVPIIAHRMRNQRGIMTFVVFLTLIGIIGLLLESMVFAYVWAIFLGIGIGGCLSLSLMLITLRSPDAEHAAQLSGMAQSVGYLIAASGPVLFGYFFSVTNSWSVPLFILVILSILLFVIGVGAGKNVYVTSE